MEKVKVRIDGREIEASAGETILEAALEHGITIPNLCHERRLAPYGACRLCIVEVEGARGLPTACTTKVTEGMVVRTRTEELERMRRMLLELLLSEHPNDCLTCEKEGDCKLQDLAYRYGLKELRFRGELKPRTVADDNPAIARDPAKCILCGRCVRICDEIQGACAIDFARRGNATTIEAPFGEGLLGPASDCELCGQCVSTCPTGALADKQGIGLGRSRDLAKVLTTCVYCGVGCQMYLDVDRERNRLVKVSSAIGLPPNDGTLCIKGRYGYDFVNHPDRLTKPLIRKEGAKKTGSFADPREAFREASWEEALDLAAKRLEEIKAEKGADAIAVLSSAKCTNEENFAMQKFARAVIGTNNVDHCARLCHASTVAGLAAAFGSGAMTNSIEDILDADVIFVTGSDTTEAHPVIGSVVRRAVRQRGAKLIVADPRKIKLTKLATLHLQQRCGTDVALLAGLAHAILAEGLADEAFVRERTEGIEELREAVREYTPALVSKITGVGEEKILEAARLYGKAERATILYAMGITQHTTGVDNVKAIANLAMLTGNIGRAGTGVNPLRGQSNVQGACDMGALPNVLPGYQRVSDDELRGKFEKAWGCRIPAKPGLTVVEMMNAAVSGAIAGMYFMGENPALSDPDIHHVREALAKVEFLAVQDIFLTETAAFADVVLPVASFAEKDGTITNTERRVRRVRKALAAPGEALVDWEVTSAIAERMGKAFGYGGVEEILAEINDLTPIYGGITWERVSGLRGLQWPCPDEGHAGTAILHREKFTRGKGKFHPVRYLEAKELPDEEYPMVLTTGRVREHWHTGTMSRRARILDGVVPGGWAEVHPKDAAELGIEDGEAVRIVSRRGEVVIGARIVDKTLPGTVFLSFHWKEAPANALTIAALDPEAKIPEYKVCAVRIEKGQGK
ncbi:MAG: formate dehydrogenase subunit alpha [Planctomycetota bacterium]